jgi:hypothetical protein
LKKLIIYPKPKIDLFIVLKISYHPQHHAFEQHGYIYDKEHSDHETQVYHRHPRKHTIISTKGTNPYNLHDIGVDTELILGNIKNTKRFKKTEKALKYANDNLKHRVHLVGHSLGHAISSIASGKHDKVTGVNGPPHRHEIKSKNYKHYGVEGDIISKYAHKTHNIKHEDKKVGAHSYHHILNHQIEL